MILGTDEIYKLIKNKCLISGCPSIENQIQANGFDLTANKILELRSRGEIFIHGKKIPNYKEVPFHDEKNQTWLLKPRTFLGLRKHAYTIVLNERIILPEGITALHVQRSSMARSGVFTVGLGDVGYDGQWTCALVIENPKGIVIQKNAGVVQIVFEEVKGNSKQYHGTYLKEKYT